MATGTPPLAGALGELLAWRLVRQLSCNARSPHFRINSLRAVPSVAGLSKYQRAPGLAAVGSKASGSGEAAPPGSELGELLTVREAISVARAWLFCCAASRAASFCFAAISVSAY